MVAGMFSVKSIPDPVAKDLHEKTKGNPFLTEAIVQVLKDAGKYVRCNMTGAVSINKKGEVNLDNLDSTSLPTELNGLITSKVDKLSPAQQMVLKVASLIGQELPSDMLPGTQC